MPRTTMAALIARTRLLTSDTNLSAPIFTDDEVQGSLDRARIDFRYYILNAQVTYQLNTPTLYTDYYSALGDWEDGPTLTSYQWVTIDPATYDEDPITGHWHFTAGQLPDVKLTGASYDLHAAAAELLEAWAAKVMLDFDFKSGEDAYTRSQKQTAILAAAKAQRAKRRLTEVSLRTPDHSHIFAASRYGKW